MRSLTSCAAPPAIAARARRRRAPRDSRRPGGSARQRSWSGGPEGTRRLRRKRSTRAGAAKRGSASLSLGLAVDAECGVGNRRETLRRDRFTAVVALTVRPLLQLRQRAVDLRLDAAQVVQQRERLLVLEGLAR